MLGESQTPRKRRRRGVGNEGGIGEGGIGEGGVGEGVGGVGECGGGEGGGGEGVGGVGGVGGGGNPSARAEDNDTPVRACIQSPNGGVACVKD